MKTTHSTHSNTPRHPISSHPCPPHLAPLQLTPPYPTPSNVTPSHPTPIPHHPTLAHPSPPHPVSSHPIPSHLIHRRPRDRLSVNCGDAIPRPHPSVKGIPLKCGHYGDAFARRGLLPPLSPPSILPFSQRNSLIRRSVLILLLLGVSLGLCGLLWSREGVSVGLPCRGWWFCIRNRQTRINGNGNGNSKG